MSTKVPIRPVYNADSVRLTPAQVKSLNNKFKSKAKLYASLKNKGYILPCKRKFTARWAQGLLKSTIAFLKDVNCPNNRALYSAKIPESSTMKFYERHMTIPNLAMYYDRKGTCPDSNFVMTIAYALDTDYTTEVMHRVKAVYRGLNADSVPLTTVNQEVYADMVENATDEVGGRSRFGRMFQKDTELKRKKKTD